MTTPFDMREQNHEAFLRKAREKLNEFPDAGRLVLDMSRTARIDVCGLTALVDLRDSAQKRGCTVCVKNLRDRVARLLVQNGFDTVFEIG